MNQRWEFFHASAKREDTALLAPGKIVSPQEEEEKEEKKGFFVWQPIYSVPLGIAFAVPAIHYEWYIFNEETQLAACFIAFVAVIYKNFGGTIYDALEEDGRRILEEQNKVEDQVIAILQEQRDDIAAQANVVQDAKDVYALKVETYEKLNAVGKIKPLHEFKAQVEKILTLVEHEEKNMIEKQKVSLMEEATLAVTNQLLTNKKLQKQCLDNAIAQLKGEKTTSDPVKDTYVQFFKWKAGEAGKMDAAAETMANREAILTKMNAVAANEGFFFKFGADGKPVMNA